jgi:putative transposase
MALELSLKCLATFYKWRSKYGDANVNIVKRLKELEVKNSRLKTLYRDDSTV